jgi:hypothetical protein
MPADRDCLVSRRRLFLIAGAGVAAWLPLDAATVDFWNKKAPADWTSEEIDRLITKSPWAKQVKAQYASGEAPYDEGGGYPTGTGRGPAGGQGGGGYPGGGYPGGGQGGGGYPGGGQGGGGYPGGTGRSTGGIGIPGIGSLKIPGLGGKGRGGGAVSPYEGIVRWESARPILEAMKVPLPEAFEGRYVISVSGVPLMNVRSTRSSGEDEDATTSRRHEQDDLDRLKGLTSLEARGRDPLQAGVVARQIGTGSSFLFGFSRELLPLETRDTDFMFSTQLGGLIVRAHFVPKEMLYHGELAV